MNNLRKKNAEIRPILKEKDKEDKGLALQLVPEYVDKKSIQNGCPNPNYVFAGALYIPKDIIQIVNSNDTGTPHIQMGSVSDAAKVFDDQAVSIEDPDVRKYVTRILRYFKYDPDEAMATLREASFKIKNRARGIVKRTYSQNAVTKLQAWRAKVQYSEEGESEDDFFNHSSPPYSRKAPLIEEDVKDEYFFDGGPKEVSKPSLIRKTFTRLIPTRSSTKISRSHRERSSSNTQYSSDGEKSSKKNKVKSKQSRSMSQLMNDGNKQVTGFLTSVTTDPEEKHEHFKKFKLNKIFSKKLKKIISVLKKIQLQKHNVHNKTANTRTNFIYSERYLICEGSLVEKKSSKPELSLSEEDEQLLRYLTAPRIHHCETYTVMLLGNENPQNLRSHNRKKALKKLKKRLQRLDSLPINRFEADQFYNPCSTFDRMVRNSNNLKYKKTPAKQKGFIHCLQSYNALDNRRGGHRNNNDIARRSVDIIADTFVNVIDSPDDPKCKVEITGQGYKGQFNVGLDPIIDEVLYHSLQNLKETYENSRDYYRTSSIDRRRTTPILSNIADNVRNYLVSKVGGRATFRSSIDRRFSSENFIGRTTIHRLRNGHEGRASRLGYRDMNMKHPRHQRNRKRSGLPLKKSSRHYRDYEKSKCQPRYSRSYNAHRPKCRRKVISSDSDSFEERQYVRRTKCPASPEFESTEDSFILKEESSTLDSSIRLYSRGGSTVKEVNKKPPLKNRDVRKPNNFPDLSYISEKDWKAATEMFIKEREGSLMSADKNGPVQYRLMNGYGGGKTEEQSSMNNPNGNNKVVKMKETMTTTENGVTTVTQTEVIKAVNQSSQCIISSASNEELVKRLEFSTMLRGQNECRKEESFSRLGKGPQRQRNLFEEVSVPYKKGINHDVFPHKNKDHSRNVGYIQSRFPRSYEMIDEKNLYSTISIGKVGNPEPKNGHVFFTRRSDLHDNNNSRNHWRKEPCHCMPRTVNTYPSSRQMPAMATRTEITKFQPNPNEYSGRNILIPHKVHSDPTIAYQTKTYSGNFPKVCEDKMHFNVHALTEIERECTPFKRKETLQPRISRGKSEKKESQMVEEVIVAGKGKTKIRVSLGACDRSQRQQAFLELMEELQRRLETENQLMNNASSQVGPYRVLKECKQVQGCQTIHVNRHVSHNTRKVDRGTLTDINKKTTVVMTSTADRPVDRMRICHGPVKEAKVCTTKRASPTVYCHRPCFCKENRKSVAWTNKEPVPKSDAKPKRVSVSVQTDVLYDVEKPKEKVKVVETSSQTDDLTVISSTESSDTKSSTPTEQTRSSLPSPRLSSRRRTGSLFLKSEKNSPRGSIERRSESLSFEQISKEKSARSSKTEKDEERISDPIRKSSRRDTRGTLFVRRPSGQSEIRESRPPEVRESRPSGVRESRPSETKKSHLSERRESKPPQPSVINQRVWIQNVSLPVKYSDLTDPDATKEKATHSSETSELHSFKEASSISFSSESDNSTDNSNTKTRLKRRMLNNKFSKIKRNSLSVSHQLENVLPREKNEQTRKYSSQKENKRDKFTVASTHKVPYKSGLIDSISIVSFPKSSSSIDLITDSNSVYDLSSKFGSDTTLVYSRKSNNSTSSSISKYAKRSNLSFGSPQEKSSCTLLSYEESPSLVEYVENIKHLPSESPSTSDESINTPSRKGILKHCATSSKSQSDEKLIISLNEKENCCNSLQYFSERDEDIENVPSIIKIRKEYTANSSVDLAPGETKLPNTISTKTFRGKKSTSSGSTDSRTTVISGPIVYKKRLAMRLQNFITKRPVSMNPKADKKINPSKRKGSATECAIVSEKNKTFKSKFKRFNSRHFMRRIHSGNKRIKNLPIVERISSDGSEFSDDSESFLDIKQIDKYSTGSSTSQKANERLKRDSTVSEVVVEATYNVDKMTEKRCITETVNIKKHEGKSPRGKRTSKPCNLNSTICINDDCVQSAEAENSDETNCTTIGYDCSNDSFKKSNSKVSKRYKYRTMDQTICSSTAWIVHSSDSELETNATHTEYIRKHSKINKENESKSNTEFVMVTTDLRRSSSELLTNRRSPKRTFIHRKRTLISSEFKPCESKQLVYSLSRKERNSVTEHPNN